MTALEETEAVIAPTATPLEFVEAIITTDGRLDTTVLDRVDVTTAVTVVSPSVSVKDAVIAPTATPLVFEAAIGETTVTGVGVIGV